MAGAAVLLSPVDALSLSSLFKALASRFGGDTDPLEENAILRLVDAARAGDRAARQRIYRQYVDRVFRTVRGILRSEADAEEVTQDAMLTVLTSLERYVPRSGTRFIAWVTTIALNTARRRFRRRRPDLADPDDLAQIPDDAADPARALDSDRQRPALLRALAELEDREREILSLRYGSELDASEIARALAPQRPHRGSDQPDRGPDMTEDALSQTWTTLEPTARQGRIIDARVARWLDARESSLAAEWLELLRVNWIEGLGYAAVAASLMLVATPLSWLARSVL
jgi:RNA polymerase sigma-70 factor, ECF subfamily